MQVVNGQPGQQPVLIDTIRRQEVDAVLNNQNIILNTANEIKSFVGELHTKTESILNNQARAPTAQVHIIYLYLRITIKSQKNSLVTLINIIAQVQPMGYDHQSFMSEIRDGLNTLKKDIKTTVDTDCPNCLTIGMFLLFIAIQMMILLVYSIYR